MDYDTLQLLLFIAAGNPLFWGDFASLRWDELILCRNSKRYIIPGWLVRRVIFTGLISCRDERERNSNRYYVTRAGMAYLNNYLKNKSGDKTPSVDVYNP